MKQDELAQPARRAQGAQGRHRDVTDPVEVLAAFGGFEIGDDGRRDAGGGSKRHLIIVDGMAACAALMVASRIAAPVTDYCVFCRSHSHHGLDVALALFRASALLELGMDSTDGTGATLAWPLVKSAAALLTEVAEGEDPGPSRPSDIGLLGGVCDVATIQARRRSPERRGWQPYDCDGRVLGSGCGSGSASAGGCGASAAGASTGGGRRMLGVRGTGARRRRSARRQPVAAAPEQGAGGRWRQRRQFELARSAAPSRGPSEAPR